MALSLHIPKDLRESGLLIFYRLEDPINDAMAIFVCSEGDRPHVASLTKVLSLTTVGSVDP